MGDRVFQAMADAPQSQTTEWNVAITCQGCVRAVTAVVGKTPGVESVQCDVENRRVTVVGTAGEEQIAAALARTGKEFSRVVV